MLQYHLTFKEGVSLRLQEQNSRRILYLDTLKGLARDADRDSLSLLTKLHIRASGTKSTDTLAFQEIRLPPEHLLEALRLTVKTGRLFFQNAPLQGHFEKPLKIYWKGDLHSEKSATLRAFLQIGSEEVFLETLEKVFYGACLWKGALYALESAIPWKWVELFLKGPLLLEGVQKKRFLEEEPPVVWKKQEVAEPLQAFPLLMLTDPTGCFANLWMEYPNVGRVAFEDLAPTVAGKVRLKKEEASWEQDLLESGFLKKVVGTSRYFCPGDKVKETLLFLLDLGWKVEDHRQRTVVKQTGFSGNVREENGSILFEGNLLFQDKKGALKPTSGLWVDLDATSVGLLDKKKSPLLEGEWEGNTYRCKKGQLGALLPLLDASNVFWESALHDLAEGLKRGALRESFPPSTLFQGTLLSYQQKGLDWLSFLYEWGFSGLLADEMGLGKTVQVLAFFSRLKTNLPVLIVAPSSLLYNWKCEIARFLPNATTYIHTGPDRVKDASHLSQTQYVITSYALLRQDKALFTTLSFEVIVLDESNAIKTYTTETAAAAFALKGRMKIALSGTPVENRKEELWSQFRFLAPDLLGSRPEFQAASPEHIRQKITPFLLRRKKSEVELELPEKIEQIAWVEMHPEQQAIYDAYLQGLSSGLLKKIELEGASAHKMEILEAILRLRQIASDPRLVGEATQGAKIELLLEDIEDKKVLIYSQFTSMLHLIGKELSKRGKSFLYLDGSLSSEERAHVVDRFQTHEEERILLLSLKAGGVGLNLTAADYVFLFDPWWNEAVENQAIDRAHRIGQKKTVIAKRYLTPQSIEEKMLRLKEEKQDAAELLLEGVNSPLQEEDWFHLLS